MKKSNYSGQAVVSLDRRQAIEFKEKGKPDPQATYTLFGQLFQQINSLEPGKLRNDTQPLRVEFRGEYGDDVGGLFRETFFFISNEIESPVLPLFILSPNGRNDQGKNRDVYLPNPTSITPTCVSMYEFLGKLMGMAIRSKTPLTLNIADFFWKRLVGMDITIEDIIAVDQEFANRVGTILDSGKEEDEGMWSELCKQMNLTYTVTSIDGRVVELFPGGQDVYVSWAERMHYIEMVEDYRIKEMNPQIDAVCKLI